MICRLCPVGHRRSCQWMWQMWRAYCQDYRTPARHNYYSVPLAQQQNEIKQINFLVGLVGPSHEWLWYAFCGLNRTSWPTYFWPTTMCLCVCVFAYVRVCVCVAMWRLAEAGLVAVCPSPRNLPYRISQRTVAQVAVRVAVGVVSILAGAIKCWRHLNLTLNCTVPASTQDKSYRHTRAHTHTPNEKEQHK